MSISRRKFIKYSSLTSLVSTVSGISACSSKSTGTTKAILPKLGDLPVVAERPRIRWWWPGGAIHPDQIEAEVHALADAGFGGFEIADVRDGITVPMDPKQFGWGGERWVAGVERALEIAAKRNMKVDITLGAHWPTGMPGVTPNDKAAAKELVHGAITLNAGESYHGAVPASTSNPSGLHMHETPPEVIPELLAVHAYRVVGQKEESTILDPTSLVNLLSAVTDGQLAWQAPNEGHWVVIGFWMRGTAQTQNMFDRIITTSMLSDPVACAVDVYGKAGTQVCIDYWEKHLMPPRTRELMRQIGGNFFEDSLELKAVKHWSPDMPEEFMSRRGYDLMAMLPLLAVKETNEWVWGPGIEEDKRPFLLDGVDQHAFDSDFQHTLTEMYAHNRIETLSAWAKTLGMGMRAQCSGLAASYCTVPEGDNGDTIDSFLAKAAARDIGGHSILSDEAATFVGGQAHVADWKLLCFMLQRDFAGGVNQVVLHGHSYKDAPGATWPGFSAFGHFIGNDWGPRMPLWKHASDSMGYLARLQHVLQSGLSQADVVVLDATERKNIAFNMGRNGNDFGDALRLAGYTRHHVDADLITHPNVRVENGIMCPDGAGYRAMVVRASETMALSTIEILQGFAANGLRIVVVGDAPKFSPGLGYSDVSAIDLSAAWNSLIANPNVKNVANDELVMAQLKALDVHPALSFSKPSRVMPIVRRVGQERWFYLLNDSDAKVELDVSVAGEGIPIVHDAWTGSYRQATSYQVNDGRVTIPLVFEANEAIVFALTNTPDKLGVSVGIAAISGQSLARMGSDLVIKANEAGTYSVILADGPKEYKLPASPSVVEINQWLLDVETWHPGKTASDILKQQQRIELQGLQPWVDITGLENASGIGTYSTSVEVTTDMLEDGGVELALGQVRGSFRVLINGRALPVINQYQPKVDITEFVIVGKNLIEVEVATTLNNVIRGLGKTPKLGFLPEGVEFPAAEFSNDWQPPIDANPLMEPNGAYLGAPVRMAGPGGAPGMAPGAASPGGQRTALPYGLIGPVKLMPYKTIKI